MDLLLIILLLLLLRWFFLYNKLKKQPSGVAVERFFSLSFSATRGVFCQMKNSKAFYVYQPTTYHAPVIEASVIK